LGGTPDFQRFLLALPRVIEAPSAARVRLAQAILLDAPPGRDALDRAVETGRALFAGDGEALAALAKRHGTVAGPDLRPRLEAGYRALRAAGHYAGATVVADGEVFHRIDRLALLEARLARHDEVPLFPLVDDSLELLMANGAPRRVTLYASFQCPYSYLALTRLLRLGRDGVLEVEERPVRPLVMRGLRVPPVKRSYALMDAAREAARHGIPFGPFCEPRDAGVQRAIFVWHEASREGKGLAFMESALRGVWVEAADLEDDGDLTRIAARAGLGSDVVPRALLNREGLSRVEAHREARAELGLWGVPSLEVGERSTWGQDRIPLLFRGDS
jgi:2-hydroxychromene-2-carboxylate isomerase